MRLQHLNDMFFYVLTWYQTVEDRRTDGRTGTSTAGKTALCNVSRGKN